MAIYVFDSISKLELKNIIHFNLKVMFLQKSVNKQINTKQFLIYMFDEIKSENYS